MQFPALIQLPILLLLSVSCSTVPFSLPFVFLLFPFIVSFPLPSPFCYHVPFLAILSFLIVPVPLSFPFLFFSTIVSCSFFLFLVLSFCMFAVCSMQRLGTYVVFKCMHAYIHSQTDSWNACLVPKNCSKEAGGETMTGQLDIWTFYPFHCSMCLSSSFFLSSCLFPFLCLVSFPVSLFLTFPILLPLPDSWSCFCSPLFCVLSLFPFLFPLLLLLLLLPCPILLFLVLVLSFYLFLPLFLFLFPLPCPFLLSIL